MDKVWKLESLIDEMKESHLRDLTALEKTDREDKVEAAKVEEGRVKELETEKQTLKKEYETEIDDLAREHKKEVHIFNSNEVLCHEFYVMYSENRNLSAVALEPCKEVGENWPDNPDFSLK